MRFAALRVILFSIWLLLGAGLEWVGAIRAAGGVDSLDSLVNDTGWCEERRWVMGTQLRVVIVSDCEEIRDVMDAVFDEAKRWDALLSNYDPASPLSQINANAGEFVDVPEDLFRYLERAKTDAARTGGIFDITVGPLMSAHREGFIGADGLVDILENVGIDNLEIRADDNGYYARLARPGMALDPGGDGKGVAVDAMANKLRDAGVTRALIDFGGSTYYGLGAPPMEAGWPVAISGEDGRILGTVLLSDRALSVSASSRRDLSAAEDRGKTVSAAHIVDPCTGLLIVDPRTAVVVSASSTTAEVLSTVLVVTGKEGLDFCDRFRHTAAAVFAPGRKTATAGEFGSYFAK